jgi:hypothetical protein
MTGIFTTPRPVPSRKWPAAAGSAVVLCALPVVLAAGAPISGWILAAVMWIAGEALALVLGRLPLGLDNLAASGMRGVGMTLRTIAIMVALVAVTAANKDVGVTAALTFVAAYSFELLVSFAAYFGGRR